MGKAAGGVDAALSPAKLTSRQVREFLAKVPFNMRVGIRLRRVHRDGITLECPLRPELMNITGAVHGGVAATLADAAVGLAIQRHFGARRPIATVELKINYFRPVTAGRIFARSHLLHIGSRLCTGRVELTDARGRPSGAAVVTYIFLDVRATARSARPLK